MLVYTQSRFKPKKKRKPKGIIARKFDPKMYKTTEKLPTLSYGPRVGASFASTLPSLTTSNNLYIERKESMKYTGDKLLGIATMHKSNMVPVFKQEDAAEIARMRRG